MPTEVSDTRAERRDQSPLLTRLGMIGLPILAVLCCLAAPLLVGAAGALTLGAVLRVGAGAAVLLALCLYVVWRARTSDGC